jgi:hypothetical protein
MIDSLFKPRQGREIFSLFENFHTFLGIPEAPYSLSTQSCFPDEKEAEV